MLQRIGKIAALSTVSAAFAIGGLGAGAASAHRDHPEDGPHHSGHHHCNGAQAKKRNNCEKHHHQGHGADDGPNHT
jgi:hypothetical protein